MSSAHASVVREFNRFYTQRISDAPWDAAPCGCSTHRSANCGTCGVHPDARGLGLGRRLVDDLEVRAAALGLRTVRLGTHRVLTEALRLYRAAGYTEIPPYGDTAHQDYNLEESL